MFSLPAFRLGVASFIAYPWESFALVVRFIMKILGLGVFWYLILQDGSKQLDIRHLISYFLISVPIGEFTMAANAPLGRAVRHGVKTGSISQIMIKPVGLIEYYYSYVLGERIVRNALFLISVIAGLILLPPASVVNFLQFIILFVTSSILGFVLNMFEASMSLLFTEVTGIKNAIMHVSKLLSGSLIPLSLFPDAIRFIVELTPFPSLVFGPIAALNFPDTEFDFGKYLLISSVWSTLLLFGVLKLWRFGLKRYEVFGL